MLNVNFKTEILRYTNYEHIQGETLEDELEAKHNYESELVLKQNKNDKY